jgi:hypothetical protein
MMPALKAASDASFKFQNTKVKNKPPQSPHPETGSVSQKSWEESAMGEENRKWATKNT